MKNWELPCGPTVWAVMLGMGMALASAGELFDAFIEDRLLPSGSARVRATWPAPAIPEDRILIIED